jgi:NTP pyrophosphatase (non-canonical NTP hydrolase)
MSDARKSLDELRAAVAGVKLIAQIDGWDVIRRSSVLDLIDQRRLQTEQRQMVTAQADSEVEALTDEIKAEVARATAKFPTWPNDPLHALAVLGEEFGELTKAMLQLTYEPHKTSANEVRSEAIQTAAMALRLAMSLHRYLYTPSRQHGQGGRTP